jgi:hypothetical protein
VFRRPKTLLLFEAPYFCCNSMNNRLTSEISDDAVSDEKAMKHKTEV